MLCPRCGTPNGQGAIRCPICKLLLQSARPKPAPKPPERPESDTSEWLTIVDATDAPARERYPHLTADLAIPDESVATAIPTLLLPSPGVRILASIIDGLLIVVFASLVGRFTIDAAVRPKLSHIDGLATAFSSGALNVVIGVTFLFVGILSFVTHRYLGFSPGKGILRLRLVAARTGVAPSSARLVVRSLGAVAFSALGGATYAWWFIDRRMQTLHDRLAGTVTVRRSPVGHRSPKRAASSSLLVPVVLTVFLSDAEASTISSPPCPSSTSAKSGHVLSMCGPSLGRFLEIHHDVDRWLRVLIGRNSLHREPLVEWARYFARTWPGPDTAFARLHRTLAALEPTSQRSLLEAAGVRMDGPFSLELDLEHQSLLARISVDHDRIAKTFVAYEPPQEPPFTWRIQTETNETVLCVAPDKQLICKVGGALGPDTFRSLRRMSRLHEGRADGPVTIVAGEIEVDPAVRAYHQGLARMIGEKNLPTSEGYAFRQALQRQVSNIRYVIRSTNEGYGFDAGLELTRHGQTHLGSWRPATLQSSPLAQWGQDHPALVRLFLNLSRKKIHTLAHELGLDIPEAMLSGRFAFLLFAFDNMDVAHSPDSAVGLLKRLSENASAASFALEDPKAASATHKWLVDSRQWTPLSDAGPWENLEYPLLSDGKGPQGRHLVIQDQLLVIARGHGADFAAERRMERLGAVNAEIHRLPLGRLSLELAPLQAALQALADERLSVLARLALTDLLRQTTSLVRDLRTAELAVEAASPSTVRFTGILAKRHPTGDPRGRVPQAVRP
jgi:uncharacterized RDD family membrane protein YckC